MSELGALRVHSLSVDVRARHLLESVSFDALRGERIDGSKRTLLMVFAYATLPGAMLIMGFLLTRRRVMR
jgi:hypothetical protein